MKNIFLLTLLSAPCLYGMKHDYDPPRFGQIDNCAKKHKKTIDINFIDDSDDEDMQENDSEDEEMMEVENNDKVISKKDNSTFELFSFAHFNLKKFKKQYSPAVRRCLHGFNSCCPLLDDPGL